MAAVLASTRAFFEGAVGEAWRNRKSRTFLGFEREIDASPLTVSYARRHGVGRRLGDTASGEAGRRMGISQPPLDRARIARVRPHWGAQPAGAATGRAALR